MLPILLESHLKRDALAHGYMLIGSQDMARTVVLAVAKQIISNFREDNLHLNPNFHEVTAVSVGINDIREIIRLSSLRTADNSSRIFFINSESITAEASNALLKTIEEPSLKTIFFIRTPSEDSLINTVKSRLVKVVLTQKDNIELLDYFDEFRKKTYTKKLDQIKKITEDRGMQEKFLNAYEVYFDKIIRDSSSSQKNINSALKRIEDLIYMRNLITGPASYPKAILEYLTISSI